MPQTEKAKRTSAAEERKAAHKALAEAVQRFFAAPQNAKHEKLLSLLSQYEELVAALNDENTRKIWTYLSVALLIPANGIVYFFLTESVKNEDFSIFLQFLLLSAVVGLLLLDGLIASELSSSLKRSSDLQKKITDLKLEVIESARAYGIPNDSDEIPEVSEDNVDSFLTSLKTMRVMLDEKNKNYQRMRRYPGAMSQTLTTSTDKNLQNEEQLTDEDASTAVSPSSRTSR